LIHIIDASVFPRSKCHVKTSLKSQLLLLLLRQEKNVLFNKFMSR